MKAEKRLLSADLYKVKGKVKKYKYIWDFGYFTLVGSNSEYPEKPHNSLSNYFFIQFTSGKDDFEESNILSKTNTKEVEFYIANGSIYIITDYSQAKYGLDKENNIYEILEKDVVDDEKNKFVVQEKTYINRNHKGNQKELVNPEEKIKTPLNKLY